MAKACPDGASSHGAISLEGVKKLHKFLEESRESEQRLKQKLQMSEALTDTLSNLVEQLRDSVKLLKLELAEEQRLRQEDKDARALAELCVVANSNGTKQIDQEDASVHSGISSKATSAFTVIPTIHSAERLCERGITTREVQSVVKHGSSFEQENGKRRLCHDDVEIVMDKTAPVLVTSWRTSPASFPTLSKAEAALRSSARAALGAGDSSETAPASPTWPTSAAVAKAEIAPVPSGRGAALVKAKVALDSSARSALGGAVLSSPGSASVALAKGEGVPPSAAAQLSDDEEWATVTPKTSGKKVCLSGQQLAVISTDGGVTCPPRSPNPEASEVLGKFMKDNPNLKQETMEELEKLKVVVFRLSEADVQELVRPVAANTPGQTNDKDRIVNSRVKDSRAKIADQWEARELKLYIDVYGIGPDPAEKLRRLHAEQCERVMRKTLFFYVKDNSSYLWKALGFYK